MAAAGRNSAYEFDKWELHRIAQCRKKHMELLTAWAGEIVVSEAKHLEADGLLANHPEVAFYYALEGQRLDIASLLFEKFPASSGEILRRPICAEQIQQLRGVPPGATPLLGAVLGGVAATRWAVAHGATQGLHDKRWLCHVCAQALITFEGPFRGQDCVKKAQDVFRILMFEGLTIVDEDAHDNNLSIACYTKLLKVVDFELKRRSLFVNVVLSGIHGGGGTERCLSSSRAWQVAAEAEADGSSSSSSSSFSSSCSSSLSPSSSSPTSAFTVTEATATSGSSSSSLFCSDSASTSAFDRTNALARSASAGASEWERAGSNHLVKLRGHRAAACRIRIAEFLGVPFGTRLTRVLKARADLTGTRVARKIGAHRLGMKLYNAHRLGGKDSVTSIASIYAPQLPFVPPVINGQGPVGDAVFSPVGASGSQQLTWNEYRLTPAAVGPGGLPYNPLN